MRALRADQVAGGAGAVDPYAMLNPSVSESGTDGLETMSRFCTITPLSAVRPRVGIGARCDRGQSAWADAADAKLARLQP